MSKISDDQEAHMHQLMFNFVPKARDKYIKGALEHQSNLWEFSDDELIEFMFEEVVDMVHYLGTLIQNRKNRSGKA